ncbi:MFS transporter [Actinospica robiniae]|uniref:MFS transporter n=1 Tax=Actinospica robiniae TaxID=304901 RepID=UPI0004221471|nr:MFS transporter [Actinospica robiniae]
MGLATHLRNPPGGRAARTMLTALFVDRTGSGVWNSAAVLYFTVEAGFDARRVGLLLGTAAVAGVFGSPVAGRLAGRYPARTVLMGCHLLRLCTLLIILSSTSFGVLLPAVAVTLFGDRAAKMLEMLFATEVAGTERATYQALSRSVSNAAFALGAGVTAIALAFGSRDAYRVLILLDALSFVVAAALVRRIPTSIATTSVGLAGKPASRQEPSTATENPWRDRGYLTFVLFDVFMCLDDSILNVGLPLWLLTRTSAPHELVPLFLFVNTVLVVVLQMRVSAATRGPRDATVAVRRYGVLLLACCGALAAAPSSGPWFGSLLLIAAACLVTLAELMRSVSSWELSVSLAPASARPAYLGVAGMSQATQKCLGPLVLTGAVLAAGPIGWLALGGVVLGISGAQRRSCLSKLERIERAAARAAAPADAIA